MKAKPKPRATVSHPALDLAMQSHSPGQRWVVNRTVVRCPRPPNPRVEFRNKAKAQDNGGSSTRPLRHPRPPQLPRRGGQQPNNQRGSGGSEVGITPHLGGAFADGVAPKLGPCPRIALFLLSPGLRCADVRTKDGGLWGASACRQKLCGFAKMEPGAKSQGFATSGWPSG